jgi:hypothetical protein
MSMVACYTASIVQYFNGDTGRGVGSHHADWPGLICKLLRNRAARGPALPLRSRFMIE